MSIEIKVQKYLDVTCSAALAKVIESVSYTAAGLCTTYIIDSVESYFAALLAIAEGKEDVYFIDSNNGYIITDPFILSINPPPALPGIGRGESAAFFTQLPSDTFKEIKDSTAKYFTSICKLFFNNDNPDSKTILGVDLNHNNTIAWLCQALIIGDQHGAAITAIHTNYNNAEAIKNSMYVRECAISSYACDAWIIRVCPHVAHAKSLSIQKPALYNSQDGLLLAYSKNEIAVNAVCYDRSTKQKSSLVLKSASYIHWLPLEDITTMPGRNVRSDSFTSSNQAAYALNQDSVTFTPLPVNTSVSFAYTSCSDAFVSDYVSVIEKVPSANIRKVVVPLQPLTSLSSLNIDTTKYTVVSDTNYFFIKKSESLQESQQKTKQSRNVKSILDSLFQFLGYSLIVSEMTTSDSEGNPIYSIWPGEVNITASINKTVAGVDMDEEIQHTGKYLRQLAREHWLAPRSADTEKYINDWLPGIVSKIYSKVDLLPSDKSTFWLAALSYIFNTPGQLTVNSSTYFDRTLSKEVQQAAVWKLINNVMYRTFLQHSVIKFTDNKLVSGKLVSAWASFWGACRGYDCGSSYWPKKTMADLATLITTNIASGVPGLDTFTTQVAASNSNGYNPWNAANARDVFPAGLFMYASTQTLQTLAELSKIKSFQKLEQWFVEHESEINSAFDRLISQVNHAQQQLRSPDDTDPDNLLYVQDSDVRLSGSYYSVPLSGQLLGDILFSAVKNNLKPFINKLSAEEKKQLTPTPIPVQPPTTASTNDDQTLSDDGSTEAAGPFSAAGETI